MTNDITAVATSGASTKRGMVVRRNELILGRHRLTLQEMRLLLWLISEIKPGDEDFKRYRISVGEFSAVVGIEGASIYSRRSARRALAAPRRSR